MIRHKIHLISKQTNRSYKSVQLRVENLAPVMEGNGPHQRLDAACEMILLKVEEQRHIFRNVNFKALYADIIVEE